MQAAHRWGFDPNQPGVQGLLLAKRLAEQDEVEVEILKPCFSLPVPIVPPGTRVKLPERVADYLVAHGFASRFAGPS